MFKVELPYDIGTFVNIINPKFKRKEPIDCGTVSAYEVCGENDICVWVSGYKESCTGEYLLEEIMPMTDEEIENLIKERG